QNLCIQHETSQRDSQESGGAQGLRPSRYTPTMPYIQRHQNKRMVRWRGPDRPGYKEADTTSVRAGRHGLRWKDNSDDERGRCREENVADNRKIERMERQNSEWRHQAER